MDGNTGKISQLLLKLESLKKRQDEFSVEIEHLRLEINSLRKKELKQKAFNVEQDIEATVRQKTEVHKETTTTKQEIQPPIKESTDKERPSVKEPKPASVKSDIEKFIGENLINKIGIVITVIGVSIGGKYAIDNELISPLTRIVLGYLIGAGLLGFAMKLKKNYENFSAVLLSGSIAIMYFITYFAYSFYELLPQIPAFILMVMFTGFTVVSALHYNRQVIAHIGLVGAYAIPILLSNDSGRVVILFSYMLIINMGILAIAVKKYWKWLYYNSLAITWIISFIWSVKKYEYEDFTIALTFFTLFFIVFYSAFVSYKLIKKEKFLAVDVVLLLVNSFIYFGLSYITIYYYKSGEYYVGLFTLFNALVHFVVSVIIHKQKLADRNLFFLVAGMVLVFITIAIPIQLEGDWVTLLWAGEAALLFWIGKTKSVPVYEKLSYPVMFLAFMSVMHDWGNYRDSILYLESSERSITPILNIHFLSSVIVCAAFGFINVLNRNQKYPKALNHKRFFPKVLMFLVPSIFFVSLYYAFRLEISLYWQQLYETGGVAPIGNSNEYFSEIRNGNYLLFKTVWIYIYSMLFVSLIGIINIKRLKINRLGLFNLLLIAIVSIMFLSQGLYSLSELRENYLLQVDADYFKIGVINLWIRYVAFVFLSLMLVVAYKYLKQEFITWRLKVVYDFFLHTVILWVASSEVINYLDIIDSSQSYKLGLSILWGIYALFMIILGIKNKQKYLRIGAISLFGVTLIKLFFYDISHMETIAKTVVFVSLGVLLLIISFLYNKYKHIISNEVKE